MQIKYHRTFSQFVDNYLASYFSAGVQTFRRIAGGPIIIAVGVSLINFGRRPSTLVFFSILLWLIGLPLALYGLAYTLRPVFNIFLVWLRREEFLGQDDAVITLMLDEKKEIFTVHDSEGELTITFEDIQSIQHRSDSAWILTKSDHMISIPRDNLLSANQDEFIETIERILDENEQKH